MAPNSDIPHEVGGLTDGEYAFFDEEYNINYTLLCRSDIFRVETEVTLPSVGGETLWGVQISRLQGWCERASISVSMESNISPNGQIGMVELRMDKTEATPENVELLRRYIVTNICSNLVLYCERYVGVKYEETGHWFYAYLHGFEICKALLVKERSTEIYCYEAGNEDLAGISEEMRVCMDMNRIDMIEPQNLISEEMFRRAWRKHVFESDIGGSN